MKIIQLTDTHLMPPGSPAYHMDPEAQLRAALADITARHGDADLLVITGDLCNHGDPEAYALLRDLLADLPFPVQLLLGNHDDRPNFIAAFPKHPLDANGYVQDWRDTPFGRLIFLDTHGAGVIGGIFDADRMEFLDDALRGAGALPVTVFVHHPPIGDGIRHFRDISLHDEGRLIARLAAHGPGVRHIVFGHIHIPMAGTSPEGISYSSGQACSHRFITDLDSPTPDWTGGNPCYRILMLDELGLRAFMAEAGQPVLSRATLCTGP
ncbi:phosphodiesterase [Pseudooceanicola sp. CBS1P-1]|uniref:Phosphodiesterase n=1 Tax=Pseudooceanicola albus TaxID=2692189 RepID=A0A6L7GBR1_9RHOB|nr:MULTISPECIES: phosphodiesterase [Pseudooceanicola]MBT9382843.1 phosphodiesterase [Pseudooceanicola endophyticus]MXN20233.1 phosphodiesterase [Pseudooceanicola albus]